MLINIILFYFTPSQCTRRVYLMQTEIPFMIAESKKNYQLNYSESYTGYLHNSDSITDRSSVQYTCRQGFWITLDTKFFFIYNLAIGCIDVSIHHTDNGVVRYLILMQEMNMVEAISQVGVYY